MAVKTGELWATGDTIESNVPDAPDAPTDDGNGSEGAAADGNVAIEGRTSTLSTDSTDGGVIQVKHRARVSWKAIALEE